MRPNLPDFDTELEATESGQRLLARHPELQNKMRFRVGKHPISGKFTLTLLLQQDECYPVEISGLFGFENHSVVVIRTREQP